MYDSVYDKVNNENTHTKLTPISTAESVSLLLLTFLILRLRVVQSFCHAETDFIYVLLRKLKNLRYSKVI